MSSKRYIMLVVVISLGLTPCMQAWAADGVREQGSGYQFHHRASFDSPIKGIYITQSTLEDRVYLEYLIKRAQKVGINTFIIDLNYVSEEFERNILLVKNSGLKYVARVVVFPMGGTADKLKSEAYWLSRYRLVEAAIVLGAEEIQLDYIRYASSTPASSTNSDDVYNVIKWFREKIDSRAKLQIDVFGESSFKESMHIGQNIPKFAPAVDAVCPMVYPSHFEPHQQHVRNPYKIIYSALESLKSKFADGSTPFKLIPYIELTNYRNHLTEEQIVGYIHSQVKAVEDAKADGWYFWSAGNKYDRLFNIMDNL